MILHAGWMLTGVILVTECRRKIIKSYRTYGSTVHIFASSLMLIYHEEKELVGITFNCAVVIVNTVQNVIE